MFLGSIIYVENIEKQNIQEEESIEKTISEEKVPVKIRDKTFYFNPILAKQMTEDILPWLRSIPKKNVCKSKPNIVQQSGKSTPPSGARLHKNVFYRQTLGASFLKWYLTIIINWEIMFWG